MYSVFLVMSVALLSALGTDAAKWSYEGKYGPHNWWNISEFCNGTSQSPINIDTDTVQPITLDPWVFHNYDVIIADDSDVINNGHTVQLNVDPKGNFTPGYKISGGGLPSTYQVLQIHFHWGENNEEGSEHTINGNSFPIEMHIVHWDSATYAIPPQAVTAFQGLAVLGVMIEVGEENLAFKPMIDSLSNEKVQYKTNGTDGYILPTSELFKLEDWLPADTSRFFRYNGSLTTPGCYESVVWTVFEDPITMSLEQIEKFRMTYENYPPQAGSTMSPEDSHHIGFNYRPVQPINDRPVYRATVPSVVTEAPPTTISDDTKHAAHWSYEGKYGPQNWGNFSEFCDGTSQSPINIDTDTVQPVTLEPWVFHNYDVIIADDSDVINNGHTVQLNVDPKGSFQPGYKISGGGLPSTYQVLQIHFHWGENNEQGSEHTINGNSYPIEMHIVHWDSANYLIPPQAVTAFQGLAVLGVMIEVGEENLAFKPMIDSLSNEKVQYKTNGTDGYILPTSELFKLEDWLPADTSRFFRYNGSLTTPGCYESVVWTVFEDPITMSLEQIEKFRMTYENYPLQAPPAGSNASSEESHHIGFNFRPVQPINDRTVYQATTSPSTTDSGASSIRHRLFQSLFILCLTLMVHNI